MHDDPAARWATMETQMAHLERLVEQLNEVVIEQGRALARLQAQLRRVSDTLETSELERIRQTSGPPPHYRP